jgi:hypothetical protein
MIRKLKYVASAVVMVAALGSATQTPAAAAAVPMVHTFSCALAWDPTIPRATGEIDSNGVPSNLVIHGATGMDYRVIYYLNGRGTISTTRPKYIKTPKVWDFSMTRPISPTPVFWAGAFQVSKTAGTTVTWRANILPWPTSVPAGPNAICTTLS